MENKPMNISPDVSEKIRQFSETCRQYEDQQIDQAIPPGKLQDYNRRLDQTLRGLQEQVRRQEEALEKLRASKSNKLAQTDLDPHQRLIQTHKASRAYKALTDSDPELPLLDSVLPEVLALRETHQLVREIRSAILRTAHELAQSRERLKAEEANLRDARLVANGLQERIGDLRSERAQKDGKSPSQLARDLVQQQQKKKTELENETEKLKEAMDGFIDDTLAPMLAAEDLGGPNVGDVVDVQDITLEAGFTAHGKAKKPKGPQPDSDDGQQRIDRILNRSRGNGENGINNKREAAAAEMRQLVDNLLESSGTRNSGASYVEVPRESAASRFLVKAKIAQFHPRDARRIRLIDFARQISD